MNAIGGIIRRAKHWLVPKERTFRKVLFGPAAGCWMLLDLNHEMRLYLGVYERELWKSYRQLLKPGMKSFDVGGRDGYSALLLANSTGAEVISFECEAGGIAEMRRIFERNKLPIKAVQAFMGANTDAATTLTIDDAAEAYFIPDFLKIDVEGAEASVLRGAERILSSRRPSMIVEVHGTDVERECLAILERHDYSVSIVDRARFLPEQRPLAHNRWLVCSAREGASPR